MTREELLSDTKQLSRGGQTDKQGANIIDRLSREVLHGNVIDRIFQSVMYYGIHGLPLEIRIDGAIVESIEFMEHFSATKPLPERYRIRIFRSEPAMTRLEVAHAISDLRSDKFSLDERVELLWRLLDDFPHAEIGDLIYCDTLGMTPDQVVDEAVRRQIAHLRTLFREGDPRRNGG